MIGRFYHVLVALLWLASMAWLVAEKVLPPLLGGSPPDYNSVLSRTESEADCWRIQWADRKIGFAASKAMRGVGDVREMRSIVQFEDVPLQKVFAELLGALAKMLQPLVGEEGDYRVSATVTTRLLFDARHRLSGFVTVLDLEGMPNLLRIRGTPSDGGGLEVVAEMQAGNGSAGYTELLRQKIDLPPEALVNDSFAPRAELNRLRLGQVWTIPIYRPFPLSSKPQVIEAKVERHEIIVWDGRDVETMLVVYRSDAGSGIRVSREPIAREWVRSDGLVLRQEVVLGGLRLQFERLPSSKADPRKEWLHDERRFGDENARGLGPPSSAKRA